jgi:hypothetical protein
MPYVVIAFSLAAGCSRPLPGEGTPEARVYRERCGTTCHAPVAPSSMPYATWEMILPRMQQRIGASGQPPLGPDELATIEAYLKKYAR